MDEQAPAETRAAIIKRLVTSKRFLGMLGAALLLGAAGTAGFYAVKIKPLRAIMEKRLQTHRGLIALYDLQMAYRARNGTFANDPDTLLASSAEGPAIRARLQAVSDINTLTVVGDAEKFKLEANVLDPQRTIVKIRGPFPDKPRPRLEPESLPEPIQTP